MNEEELTGLVKDLIESLMWAAAVVTLLLPFWLLLG